MEIVIVLGACAVLVAVLFVATHLRPLNEDEVKQLGRKLRSLQIKFYFTFSRGEYEVDAGFKKRMNPNGRFYRLEENLSEFPALSAALLKYKKHEWIVVAFEKEQKVSLVWLNKGLDRSGVSLHMSVNEITTTAQSEGFTSILMFHNHPNSDPNHLDCTKPSERDMQSALEYAEQFNGQGLNLIEFVCERGRHYQYFSSLSDDFIPLTGIIESVQSKNGQSRFKNLLLHMSRVL